MADALYQACFIVDKGDVNVDTIMMDCRSQLLAELVETDSDDHHHVSMQSTQTSAAHHRIFKHLASDIVHEHRS